MKKIAILLLSIFTLTSCKDKVNHTLEGCWSIDTIYYKGKDIRFCFLSNVIDFFEKSKCELPFTEDSCNNIITTDSLGSWMVIKSDTFPRYIKIDSKNFIFAGTHKLIFYKDEKNKLLKIKLTSDHLFIIARKGFFDFDENINTINKLTNQPN